MSDDSASRFDLFNAGDFFDAETCAALVEELRAAEGAAASVYGSSAAGAVEERVRRVTRVAVSSETVELVKRRLMERRGEVEAHFGVRLGECEEPQFLRYRVGDFFVAHQDGNTPLLRLDREQARLVSLIVFLNNHADEPSTETYGGGALVFHALRAEPHGVTPAAGTLLAFRAETTHEVTPVTRGERYTIVSWFTNGR